MLRQSDDTHVRLETSSAGVTATRTDHGRIDVVATAPPADRLEIRGVAGGYELRADDALLAIVDGACLGSAAAGGFLGVWLGLVADAGAEFTAVFYSA